jgi:hypothetical protein
MTYTIEKVTTLIGARRYGDNDTNIGFILTDSRSLCFPEETLFFALKSERNDGHNYIPELYRRGVKNFVVTDVPKGYASDYPEANFLKVVNTLEALQRLAERHRDEFNIPIVGITGSNGKTMVKEWLYQLLSPSMFVTRSLLIVQPDRTCLLWFTHYMENLLTLWDIIIKVSLHTAEVSMSWHGVPNRTLLQLGNTHLQLAGTDTSHAIDDQLVDYTVTSQYIKGEKAFAEFNWEAMKVNLRNLKFTGELAYYQDKATQGYVIRVMGSHNGTKWEVLGEEKGTGLPGEATKQQVSSDPNKFQDVVRLPLRKLNVSIPLKKTGNYEHVRIEFTMPGAAWWRVKLIENTTSWRPSMHFSSVWKSELAKNAQWLYVDLGTVADFDQVNLFWVNKARQGKIQVSSDARNWSDIATLGQQKQKGLTEKVACKGHGRYVRLLLTQPDASGRYALSEMQVMGKGGLRAEAANTLASKNGKQMLNQWQLRREGSDAWIQATVPGTVLTSYMNIGAVPDNRYDDNMRQISESFFNSDFWYRTTINHQPSANKNQHTYLNFDGINWKADILLNGEKIGRIDGAFIRSRIDVTKKLKPGANKLEVHVIKNAHFGVVKQKNLQNTDLNGGELGADNPTFHASIGWDWITNTPGREIGIWNDVYLTHDNGVSVSDPLVTSTLNLPDTLATMTPSVFLKNADAVAKTVKLSGFIGKIQFEQEVSLLPNEKREVAFAPVDL